MLYFLTTLGDSHHVCTADGEMIHDVLSPGKYTVSIEKAKRTHAQNRLYWKWLTIIAHHWDMSSDDTHKCIKSELLKRKRWKLVAGKRKCWQEIGETKSLDVKAFTLLLDKVQALATAHNITLPIPTSYSEADIASLLKYEP